MTPETLSEQVTNSPEKKTAMKGSHGSLETTIVYIDTNKLFSSFALFSKYKQGSLFLLHKKITYFKTIVIKLFLTHNLIF